MTRVATVCAYLLILLLAFHSAELVWRMLSPVENVENAPAIIQDKTPISNQSKPDSLARTIAELNLFGHVNTQKPQDTASPVIRETRLNLVLRGVIATQGKSARAIIYSPSGSSRGENPYAIDDKLPGGATLKEIHSDRIVLFHNGRHETLRLPKKVVSTSATGHNISNRTRSSPRSSRASNTHKIREYRDALVNDPVSLIGLIRSAPYREDGKLVGYRVQTGRDKNALSNLGLMPGDIVTSVNGISMNNSTKLMRLLKDMAKATEVNAEVIRDGSPTTVTIRLDN